MDTDNPEAPKNHTKTCIACKSLIDLQATVCPHCQTRQSPSLWLKVGTSLKWAGGITAIFSLAIAMVQIGSMYQGYRLRQEATSELVLAGNLQRDFGDYAAAWASYSKALEQDPGHRAARQEQTQLAMIWLRNIRTVGDEETFTQIVDKISPALYRGATDASKPLTADIAAHLAWAAYLRSREVRSTPEQVEAYFDWALKLDPQNPYANVMRGFWIHFDRKDTPSTQNYFSTALEAGRAHDYVRHLQLSAMFIKSDHTISEVLRIVNEMRLNNEPLSIKWKTQILDVYSPPWSWLIENPSMQKRHREKLESFRAASLSPKDLLATFQYLTDGVKDTASNLEHRFLRAYLNAANGGVQEALEIYRSLQSERVSWHAKAYVEALDIEIQRLTQGQDPPVE